jgi:hypothetical protein
VFFRPRRHDHDAGGSEADVERQPSAASAVTVDAACGPPICHQSPSPPER